MWTTVACNLEFLNYLNLNLFQLTEKKISKDRKILFYLPDKQMNTFTSENIKLKIWDYNLISFAV